MEHRQGAQHKEHKNQTDPNLAKGMEAAAGERKDHEDTHSSSRTEAPKQVKPIPLRHLAFMLTVMFAVSFLLQAICLYFCYEENPLQLLRQPCILRWLEYAFTSLLQIVLIASSVLIRDVHTVALLFAAQLVCVLLGFVIESANAEDAVHAETHTAAIGFQEERNPPDAPQKKAPQTWKPGLSHRKLRRCSPQARKLQKIPHKTLFLR